MEIISFCLFADDTSLLYDHNNINTGIQNLNTELVKITTWLSSNKLYVNLLKTNYIIFSSGNREVFQAVPLLLNDVILQQVSHTNLFGMNVDSHFSGAPRIWLLLFIFFWGGNFLKSNMGERHGGPQTITAGTAVAMSLIVLVSDPTPRVKCFLMVSSPVGGGGGWGCLKVIVILVALQAYKDMHTQHHKI